MLDGRGIEEMVEEVLDGRGTDGGGRGWMEEEQPGWGGRDVGWKRNRWGWKKRWMEEETDAIVEKVLG